MTTPGEAVPSGGADEGTRLESLWAGSFGNDYVERNRSAGDVRGAFWQMIAQQCPSRRVLEVGCNVGGNLRWLAQHVPPQEVYGVDINAKALRELRRNLPDVNSVNVGARELPFRDGWFDLVFTMGVLIHQPEATLPLVMSEIVRCSRRYVVCGEYYAEAATEVPYRGHSGALFKRDYGRMYQRLFPSLKLKEHGFLGKDQGWDDVTFWLFEKSHL